MTGFSAEWLSLREPADRRARDPRLLARLAAHFTGRERVSILDLGCGTGANLRAMAPALPCAQDWRLIDHDPALLEAARCELEGWQAPPCAGLSVSCESADFSGGVDALLDAPCDLVTASALFDLVSPRWLDNLAAALAARSLPLYSVLIYNGVMRWEPPHAADDAVCAAFNAHQHGDKGFGPAAGPDAAPYLAARLAGHGYQVMTAASPWVLGEGDRPLLAATAAGIAAAARETGRVSAGQVEDWLTSARAAGSCHIGHVDILALPPAREHAKPG